MRMARLSPEHVIGVVGMVGGVAAWVIVWINAVGSRLLIPSRRVGVAQRVVAAVGIAVEGLGAGGILHVGVNNGEHALPVGLLGGHPSNRVVADLALRAAKEYVGQSVHLVVAEGLLQVAEVVLTAG